MSHRNRVDHHFGPGIDHRKRITAEIGHVQTGAHRVKRGEPCLALYRNVIGDCLRIGIDYRNFVSVGRVDAMPLLVHRHSRRRKRKRNGVPVRPGRERKGLAQFETAKLL